MAKFCVILPAAGKSSRFGDLHYKKPFAPINNRAVWIHTAQHFLNHKDVAQVILVVSPEDYEDVRVKYRGEISVNAITVVRGGRERADSIENAISAIHPECDFVCVHDAARPCIADEWIQNVFKTAIQTGAAILASPMTDSIKKVQPSLNDNKKKKKNTLSLDNLIPDTDEKQESDGIIMQSLDRENIWKAQTPQVFRRDWFEEAYARRSHDLSAKTTDDSMLIEQLGHQVHIVEGSSLNIKITTKTDLYLAEAIFKILPGNKPNTFHPFRNEELF